MAGNGSFNGLTTANYADLDKTCDTCLVIFSIKYGLRFKKHCILFLFTCKIHFFEVGTVNRSVERQTCKVFIMSQRTWDFASLHSYLSFIHLPRLTQDKWSDIEKPRKNQMSLCLIHGIGFLKLI